MPMTARRTRNRMIARRVGWLLGIGVAIVMLGAGLFFWWLSERTAQQSHLHIDWEQLTPREHDSHPMPPGNWDRG